MNYARIYESLMARSKCRKFSGYTEKHHIVPRCMGGDDDSSNLAVLTAREHFIAHQLLVKIYPEISGLVFALWAMCRISGKQERSSRRFEWIRKEHSKALSVLHKTRVRSEQEKANQRAGASKANKGRVVSEETRKRTAESQRLRYLLRPESFPKGHKRPGCGGRKKGVPGNYHKPRPETLALIHANTRKTNAPSWNTKGYQILTPNGFKSFDGVSFNGVVPTLEVKFTSGSIIVTPNHIFCTPNGEVKAKELVVGQELYTNETVLSVNSTGRKHSVFDLLEVDGHQYLTNGVSSHNCEFVSDTNKIILPEWLLVKDKCIKTDADYEYDRLKQYYLKYTGMDLGFKHNTCLLFGYADFQRGVFVIEDELVLNGTDVTSEAIATGTLEVESRLWDKPKSLMRISDNNNPILLNDINVKHNVLFNGTTKDSLQAMIGQTRLFIGQGKLEVHERCKYLLGCLEYGVWDKNRAAFAESRKYGHYDALAALVYLLRYVDFETNPVPKNLDIASVDLLMPVIDRGMSISAEGLSNWTRINRRTLRQGAS